MALVAPFGLRPKGTTSARVLPIARVLAAQGAAVRVVVPPWDDQGNAGWRWLQDGYEVVHTHVGPRPIGPGAVVAEMLRAIREWQPDVVHAFKPIGYSGAVAWLLARHGGSRSTRRRPLVVVDADDLEGMSGWAGRRSQGLAGAVRGIQERCVLRRAHRVTVASRWLDGFTGRLGVAEADRLYLPNGRGVGAASGPWNEELSMSNEVTPMNEKRRLGTRLLWYTRFTEASPGRVAALVAPLLREDPTLRLAVVGEELGGGDEAAARGAFARAGVGAQIDWLGYRPEAIESDALLDQLPIAIYPLDDDLVNRARCPSKIPQLMALGVPIVAEAVGEATSYLGGFRESCLARPDDAEGFRGLVRQLLTDDERRRTLSARLRKTSARWRWEATAGPLLGWYERVLAGQPDRSPFPLAGGGRGGG